jgi:hypothetical protein
MKTQNKRKSKRTDFDTDADEGPNFWLGPITRTHRLGRYQLLEYKEKPAINSDRIGGTTYFTGYIDGRGTRQSSSTLEGAIAHCIAYNQLGPNTQAGTLFMVMVGLLPATEKRT